MTSVTETAADTRRHLRVPPAVRAETRTALAALVGALVVGILGMHALANHGTPAPVAAAASAATSNTASSTAMARTSSHDVAMASGTSHDGHDHAAAVSSPAGTGHSTGHGTHDMTSMVMLCVVMLAAAALTLLALLAARILRPLLPATFLPAAVRERALPWVHGTGPPHEWQFSVIRC